MSARRGSSSVWCIISIIFPVARAAILRLTFVSSLVHFTSISLGRILSFRRPPPHTCSLLTVTFPAPQTLVERPPLALSPPPFISPSIIITAHRSARTHISPPPLSSSSIIICLSASAVSQLSRLADDAPSCGCHRFSVARPYIFFFGFWILLLF